MLDEITPLILTHDEAPNIGRTLSKLVWAERIVVIDSGSTDETLKIVESFPQVNVFYRRFVDFASQCNYGLSRICSSWVLSIDADYELSDEFIRELRLLSPLESTAGYRANFVYRIAGRSLRGSLYPARTVLYRKNKAYYENEGHGHRVVVDGRILDLGGIIYHDDRKSLGRWISSQQGYARAEACFLMETPRTKLSKTDRIRLLGWPSPILVLFYTLFVKGCILDGWAGWHYGLQRLVAEALITLELVDRRLRKKFFNQ